MERLTEKWDDHFIARTERLNGKIVGNQMCLNKLGELEDLEEQGLLLRLPLDMDRSDLIYILLDRLLRTEFGGCYMCKNPMKNITLDGVNNGCDGNCSVSEDVTTDDLLTKILRELQTEEALQKMKGEEHE